MRVALFGHSYVRDLQTYLDRNRLQLCDSRDGIFFEAETFCFPGATFSRFVEEPNLLNDLVSFCPDIVCVILGGNDLKTDYPLANVRADCKHFYELLKSRLPNCYIIAGQIESRFHRIPNRHKTPLEPVFSALANSFNCWINKQSFKDRILGLKGVSKLSKPIFYRDHTHLNTLGLARLLELVRFVIFDSIKNKT